MNIQGSQNLNLDYFTKLTHSINSASTCEELQALVQEAFDSLAGVKAAINAELAAIQPILALLTAPGADLSAIVTWITNYIENVLKPLVKPNITLAAQLTALEAQISQLIDVINSASLRFPSCSVSIPSL